MRDTQSRSTRGHVKLAKRFQEILIQDNIEGVPNTSFIGEICSVSSILSDMETGDESPLAKCGGSLPDRVLMCVIGDRRGVSMWKEKSLARVFDTCAEVIERE